ncbi:homogentisate 1,2-dioxygenase [Cristinia sonorae]|uniref:homogentisate 1,2-dioxygenase n=1 Tax=Cristinia sonorae TaxID=1940300 RepID=A0A8K0UNP3_9AGAR|nr:homogentisate 1,2-dioxygenase [Cristinia sonorae]
MASAKAAFSTPTTKEDPYTYQVGFGNSFASEAIPGTLPVGQNSPQKVKYGLYAEGVNGTSFVAPRAENQRTWLYRMRPSVAHEGFVLAEQNPYFLKLTTNFSANDPKIHVSPTQLAWHPLDVPNEPTDFFQGLRTYAGNGDPLLREGIAIHVYLANKSMEKKAYVNSDGDMLILPQQGRLDIQTELGSLMVRPGELVVIQRGLKFKVTLPDGPVRGYIQEIYGSHYELPELGPLGANGLANVRDFEHPVAKFEIDTNTPWEIVYKVGGKLFSCKQNHTPFDVVAWHGNYVPYKYAMEKFIGVGSITKDHIDPSIFCVLTAKSKTPGTPLADFLIFSGRWDVATGTFRPPYFHRNCASELMGLIYGDYEGRSDTFRPGSVSYETGFCPHGVSWEVYNAASTMELTPQRVHEGTLAFMFESSMMFGITDFAMKSDKLHEHEPGMWNDLKNNFVEEIDQVNADLKAAGLPALVQGQ